MSDRERLGRAFREAFDLSSNPGFRRLVVHGTVAADAARPRLKPWLSFALGAGTAVVLVAGAATALVLHPIARQAPSTRPTAPRHAAAPTTAQLDLFGTLVYPNGHPGPYFLACDSSGDQASCPFTARLRQQLASLHTTACFGCRTPSPTQVLVPEPAPGGGWLRVLWVHAEFDLKVVTVGGGNLLVDDIVWTCPGANVSRGVSVYSMHVVGTPGVGPIRLAPVPACGT